MICRIMSEPRLALPCIVFNMLSLIAAGTFAGLVAARHGRNGGRLADR